MDLMSKVIELADGLQESTVCCRRDLHAHPEAGWTEFRTAAIVAATLSTLGYEVETGNKVIEENAMMGRPDQQVLADKQERVISQGADPFWVEQMTGGKTGVVGTFSFEQPGPTVAIRFDMDANDVCETEDVQHYPRQGKFNSVNPGVMHACGHDGHTSVGLAVAEILLELKSSLTGKIKLIFQPAEEGVRGAKAMVTKGIVDDVDYMLGSHFGFKMKHTGQLACNVVGFLATSKYDVAFTGRPSHAGAAPEAGRNALLAAACAALNLHAISRHSEGVSRINVGVLEAGTGRNVIADKALMKLETRGATSEINEYMAAETIRIVKAAAEMYDVQVHITEMGGAAGGKNTAELSNRIKNIAQKLNIFEEIIDACNFGASEDFSYFMERVQKNKGEAAYIMVGADLAAGHHDSRFDFDEKALAYATKILASVTVELLTLKEK